jgi:alanine racemase
MRDHVGPPSTSTVAERLAGAILTIDLAAIADNYRALQARLGATACAGVVKADAYGLGAAEVASTLRQAGCRTFFVAHIGEAVTLRQVLGTDVAIYVLNGLPPGAEGDCREIGAVPVLNSLEQIRAWQAAANRGGGALAAAIQVDSGMSRLGLPPAAVEDLADDLRALAGLDVRLVMSHLACADTPEHPANRAQLATFRALRARLPDAPASFANSSGIFLAPDYHFDLARPGAALYGINPTPGLANPMRNVVKLAARVIQIREVPAGTGVGYGHSFATTAPSRLATLSLGYADGWHRCAGAAALHAGERLPFVGRVSMDSLSIDISALPREALAPGDFVELLGATQTVDDIAALAGTIGYEILTSLGHRFHRRYVGA